MEQINLKLQRTKIKLELDGKDYFLHKPNYAEMKAFEKERKLLENNAEDVSDLVIRFLEKSGLPKDVAESLEVEMISQLIDALSGSKKN